MKKTLILAAFALAALPAMAATTTVEFAPAEGDKLVAVFSDDGTVSFNGGEAAAAEIEFEGRAAVDLPNGIRAGETVRVRGASFFEFRGPLLCRIADYS